MWSQPPLLWASWLFSLFKKCSWRRLPSAGDSQKLRVPLENFLQRTGFVSQFSIQENLFAVCQENKEGKYRMMALAKQGSCLSQTSQDAWRLREMIARLMPEDELHLLGASFIIHSRKGDRLENTQDGWRAKLIDFSSDCKGVWTHFRADPRGLGLRNLVSWVSPISLAAICFTSNEGLTRMNPPVKGRSWERPLKCQHMIYSGFTRIFLPFLSDTGSHFLM